MSERVICKDSTKKRVEQTIVKIGGWSGVRCYRYERHEDYIEAGLQSTHHASKCPFCGRRSSHIHSRYERTVDDIPIHGLRVILTVVVSRYRCMNPKCSHRTFVEQCPGVTEKYQRRTPGQLRQLQELLGLVASTVGSRQCASVGMSISPSTALRIVRGIPCEIDYSSFRRLCIDDFATRKGREYRTLIIDAESHLPLEIVPSRDKSDVSEALRKYKHAAIISRDRSSAYAGAITAARPRAKQIADKFHLVKNCGEHVAEQLKSSMDKIRNEVSDIIGTPSSDTAVRYGLYRPPSPHDVEMFTKVHELKAQGYSVTTIAKMLHIRDSNVKKHLELSVPTGRKVPASKPVGRFMDIILGGVKQGKGYRAIWNDIAVAGGKVDYNALIAGMKKSFPGYKPKQGFGNKPAPLSEEQAEWSARMHLLSTKRMSLYVVNPNYGVNDKTGECSKERLLADELILRSKTLQELRAVYTSFRAVMAGTSTDDLDKWIADHKHIGYCHLCSFAKKLSADLKAIKNAIRYPFSNGPMEGCNNKVKAVKRSMYGRAKDDLLLIKIILYSKKYVHEN